MCFGIKKLFPRWIFLLDYFFYFFQRSADEEGVDVPFMIDEAFNEYTFSAEETNHCRTKLMCHVVKSISKELYHQPKREVKHFEDILFDELS